MKTNYKSQLISQKAKLTAQCDKDKNTTREVSHEYQKKLTALAQRVADLKRLRPPVCVPVTNAATGHNGTSSPAEPSGTHGIDAGSLLDYAAEAEKYRLQLIGCQDFLSRISQP